MQDYGSVSFFSQQNLEFLKYSGKNPKQFGTNNNASIKVNIFFRIKMLVVNINMKLLTMIFLLLHDSLIVLLD